jgi:cell wall-associated NlpC family hydrolase
MAAAQTRGQLPRTFDLTSLMLAGYNAGPGTVLAAGGVPPIAETQDYVQTILANAPTFAGATDEATPGSFAHREIAAARKYLGTSYAWDGGDYLGATRGQCVGGPAAHDCAKVGFDCSGLVLYAVYVASHGKIKLPHSADEQTRGGAPVPLAQLQPGDLISFTDHGATTAHHIGIYLGNNELLNAPESNAVVRIDSLATAYYRSQQWRAVRYG